MLFPDIHVKLFRYSWKSYREIQGRLQKNNMNIVQSSIQITNKHYFHPYIQFHPVFEQFPPGAKVTMTCFPL